MAGTLTQAESNVIYVRLQNAARALLDVYEEIKRLKALNDFHDFPTNLDEHSGMNVSKAEASALFAGPLTDFEAFFENENVNADGTPGSVDRRNKLSPFLTLDNL